MLRSLVSRVARYTPRSAKGTAGSLFTASQGVARCAKIRNESGARLTPQPLNRHLKYYSKTCNISRNYVTENSQITAKDVINQVLDERCRITDRPLRSKYFSEDQEPIVNDLISRLKESYKGHLTELNDGTIQLCNTSNKTFVQSVAINGMYGSGKTSLSFALPDLIRQKLTSATTIEERYLRKAFERPLIIESDRDHLRSMDVRSFDGKYADLDADLYLAVLLAVSYWFSRYSFYDLLCNITRNWESLSDQAQSSLSFSNVVKEIIADNNSKNENDRITSVYLVHDKFQHSGKLAPYVMQLLTSKHFPELFIFSAYNGTGVRAQLFLDSISPDLVPEYSVERLSIKTMKKVIATFPSWEESKILNQPKMDLFLATTGGNLEMLEETYFFDENPAAFDNKENYSYSFASKVRRRWMIDYSDLFTWTTLLSLAGCSFGPNEIVARNANNQFYKQGNLTAYDVTRRSQSSLRTRTRNGISSVLLDYPMVFYSFNGHHEISAISPKSDDREIDGSALEDQAHYLTNKYCYNKRYSFEELVVRHFVFRWNMHNYSRSNHVSASDLFNGGHFTRKFKQRLFALENKVLSVAKAVPNGDNAEVLVDHDKIVQFSLKDPKSRGLFFGDHHVFSGHLRLREFKKDKHVIVWIDAKHTSEFNTHNSSSPLTSEEINEIKVNLRAMMSAPSMSSFVHLVLVVTDRCYTPETNDDSESIDPLDDHICIVDRDGLMFGTSPWISFVAQTLREN